MLKPEEHSENYAILAENIVKTFPGTIALKGVDFKLKKGEVVGLLGKNGSGKSTLVNILAGMLRKTSGDIYFFGKKVNINNVQDSEALGFRFISQEPYLMDDLSIAENIAFREQELKKEIAVVDWKNIRKGAEEKLKRLDMRLDPDIETRYLKVSEKQLILALREVLSTGAKIIAFDEVGTALSRHDMKKVFELIREEKQKGVSFIYISHEIEEVFEICDSVLVLRDGEVVLEGNTKDLTSFDLKKAIAGRNMENDSVKVNIVSRDDEDAVLKVRDLANEKLSDINFDLYKGEILGVYGLRGSGRTELLKTLFGLMNVHTGTADFMGQNILTLSPGERVQKRIGFLPEDRLEGVFNCRPVRDNLFMSSMERNLDRFNLFIDSKKEEEKYTKIKQEFDIKAESINCEIEYLSGGNKQKVMFARCRAADTLLYLIDEGTKGIDIGAKFEIYELMRKLAADGNSFIYTSSDLDEICQISHRVMVLHSGRIVTFIDRENLKKELLLHYADGNIS
jgi:ribose transport system ATP-binding protein